MFIAICRFDYNIDNIVTEPKDSNWISLGLKDLPRIA